MFSLIRRSSPQRGRPGDSFKDTGVVRSSEKAIEVGGRRLSLRPWCVLVLTAQVTETTRSGWDHHLYSTLACRSLLSRCSPRVIPEIFQITGDFTLRRSGRRRRAKSSCV